MRISRGFPRSAALAGTLLLASAGSLAQTGVASPVLAATHVAARPGGESRQQHLRDTIASLRGKVKYVFVLYQENRSFDSYFGTFPGANGIYSRPAAQTPGYYQAITNTDGTTSTIQPFLIGPNQYASDTDDVDHSHSLIDAKMNVVGGVPQMDRFASAEEGKFTPAGTLPSLKAKQFAQLTMAYQDCDTVPLLWNYAKNFTLMDNIYQQMTGPSTPGNLSIFGAQSGQSQQVLHPAQAVSGNGNSGPGVPILNDVCPIWGSTTDPYSATTGTPYNSVRECHNTATAFGGATKAPFQTNLTYPTLPVSFEGPNAISTFSNNNDLGGGSDIGDLSTAVVSGSATISDTGAVAAQDSQVIPWGWYEEGYGANDPSFIPTNSAGSLAYANQALGSYIVHHNGPAYFGYIMNNAIEKAHLHSLTDFFNDVSSSTPSNLVLGSQGVFYLKGGYYNIHRDKPANPDPVVQAGFTGDDDHPAYSDAQLSEALVGREVDAIARSPYWSQSAIIITYDDSEGDYDHVQPPVVNNGPSSTGFIADGPRVPFIVISPYAKGGIVSTPGDHGSVVKFIDTLYNLTPLAALPNEYQARQTYAMTQPNYGPNDALTPGIDDLVDAFDPNRTPIPASMAEIPAGFNLYPTAQGQGCSAVGLTPVQPLPGESNQPPADFQARPATELSTTGVTTTVGTAGGTVTGAGANGQRTSLASLVFPTGAFSETATVGAVGVGASAAPTDTVSGTLPVGDLLQVNGTGNADNAPLTQAARPYTVTLTYNPAALPAGVTAGRLGIFTAGVPVTATYTLLPSSQDNGSGVVTAQTTSLTSFQLRSLAPAGGNGGGANTPELASGELLATALLPMAALALLYRRRVAGAGPRVQPRDTTHA